MFECLSRFYTAKLNWEKLDFVADVLNQLKFLFLIASEKKAEKNVFFAN